MSLEAVAIGIQHDPGVLFAQGEFVIQRDARRKHTAIFGTTGAGKSTLMRNMIASDIASGIGCTVVDPHGQLVEEILENHIPRSRTGDVVYFNPKDPARTIPLNLFDSPSRELDGLVVDNVVGIFKQLWPDAFAVGARMEDIMRNSFYALIEHPSPTSLWNLPPFLTDAAYRAMILRRVKNPAVRHFFLSTYNTWTTSFREEAISPVLNKVRPFLTDPRMRAVIGPAHSAFRFRTLMDERKILLCDLSAHSSQCRRSSPHSHATTWRKRTACPTYSTSRKRKILSVILNRFYPRRASSICISCSLRRPLTNSPLRPLPLSFRIAQRSSRSAFQAGTQNGLTRNSRCSSPYLRHCKTFPITKRMSAP